ncbi:uncharacterized protein N7529_005937 [Penicillium soppii]|uniref:uncharacterized protein n=1 Tax=Penicillium soppii TaxID=69789 RepID=UPI0025482A86|nr:uncharacterized protein N7529_005937 [Penicillium soppii]KAJ5864021.1 hypothetical protein N7529_005937 [Penicillium soppii]
MLEYLRQVGRPSTLGKQLMPYLPPAEVTEGLLEEETDLEALNQSRPEPRFHRKRKDSASQ